MKPSVQIASGWPLPRTDAKARARAVQALIANHTLIVGQSRSGKTNAARRLIEEVLMYTKTRVVILDPNADFRLLEKVSSPKREKDFADAWKTVAADLGIATPGGPAWGIHWSKLSMEEMAAFLRLTPKETFAEYRHLDRQLNYEKKMKSMTKTGSLEDFAKSQYFDIAAGEELERYQLLLQELASLNVWAKDSKQDLDSLLKKNHKVTIVDLSIDDEQVRTISAARTLEALWRQGEARRKKQLSGSRGPWIGTLVVIDEGHMFAPPHTEDPRKQLVCERIKRFADQGKKLNLFLMVITQQPGKLHPDVLSEFNNRIILRVNERQSLKVLEQTYGGISGRYDGALTFEQGEALIEGALLCDENPPPVDPRGVRFLMARTREGGGTPKTDWALPAGL